MKKYVIFLLSFFIFLGNVKASGLVEVKLSKCVDGDTAWFIYNDNKEKFRFLGIDTPESTNKIEAYGKGASEYTCNELTNANKIEIEFDENSDKLDKYNRYLAWIFVDGELLQSKIISQGLAEVKYIYGDYKYVDKLKKEQVKAQNDNLGIWSDNTDIEINYLYVIIIAIIVIIFYITNKSYRKKINRKIKNKAKKKIRDLY